MRRLDEHQTKDAIDYIRRSQGIVALQAQRDILEGRLYLDAGKLFAARHTFREALSNSTLAPIANYWLGATSFALNDVRAAEAYWLETLQALPHDPNAHRSLAMIYYDRGAIDHAVGHLKEVAVAAPDDARPYRLLGLIHKDYEKYDEAVQYYRSALERDLTTQTRDQVRRELAECLIKTRQYQAGLEVLEQAASTHAALVLKADCLIGLGRSTEAASLLDNVLVRDAKHADALVARAGICLEQQEYDRAVELLRRAVAVKPTDYLANFRLSQALRSQGVPAEAAEVAERAEAIKQKRERFAKLHQDATARPLDAQVRFELGELAAELELPDMARIWYRAALELDPKHSQAREKLDQLPP
jgi:tetratricopeptide (TPR) repeat protein